MSRYFLDVGGCVFSSTIETLSKSPIIKELIENTLEGDMPFIDRDATAFQYVLSFMRSGTLYQIEDRYFLASLASEAAFYGLKSMESQVSRILSERRRFDTHDLVTEIRALKTLIKSYIDSTDSSKKMSRASSYNSLE